MRSYEDILREFKKGIEEIALLERLAVTERSKVATDLGISYAALSMRIETIKKHAVWYSWYAKRIAALKRQFPYLQGLLAPKKPMRIEDVGLEL